MSTPQPVPVPLTPAQQVTQDVIDMLVNRLANHNQHIAALQNAAADLAEHQAMATALTAQLTALGWTPPPPAPSAS